uniref:AAA_lid_3 domain-containing protein n=1 Tax=Panagrellus redivivus TaxID=6233 RepID=A0A7E4VM31_PANRE
MDIPEAKLIVMGMTAHQFSIADPTDRGMLDIVGLDSSTPEVVRSFTLGELTEVCASIGIQRRQKRELILNE